jgi:Xaa-Pro aminopeptidase
VNLNENDRFTDKVSYSNLRFAQEIIAKYPAHQIKRSAPILANIRMVKEPEEIELLKEAIRITKLGFERLLKFVKPGVWEYEIEAELIHEFIRNKSRGFALIQLLEAEKCLCTSLHRKQQAMQRWRFIVVGFWSGIRKLQRRFITLYSC